MHRILKVLAVAALALAVAVPLAFASSSHSVKMKVTIPCAPSGTKICATYGGKPFGTCTMKGTLVIPESIQTWSCKGGKFRVTATGTSGASNDAKGTWVLSHGSGKYKGISGKGTFAGLISTGVFSYSGTAKY